MSDTKVYTALLRLQEPWYISKMDVDSAVTQNSAILAFIARASTTAVGATNGAILMHYSTYDLYSIPIASGIPEAPFTDARDCQRMDGFSDGDLDHSGEFNDHIQRRPGPQTFWKEVCVRIGE